MPLVEMTSITLKMLIDAGVLIPGQVIHPIKGSRQVEGVLNEDGTISLNIDTRGKRFNSPSGAAKAVENSSINGWIYWGVKEQGNMVELSVFRQKLKQTD